MPKAFEDKLIETLERSNSFKGFADGHLNFEIDRINKLTNKYFKYNFSIELSYKEEIPMFKIVDYRRSQMRGCGHTYMDGVLCHNIPPYKASEKSGEWYGLSIVQFVGSLVWTTKTNQLGQAFHLLISSIPENDIVEYEHIAHGTFFILSEVNLESVLIDNKYTLTPADRDKAKVPVFNRITNPYFSGNHWTVVEKMGNIISLSMGETIVKARFQQSIITDEENINKRKSISVIGAGSLGSYFIANYVKDYLNGTMNIIDGDVYLFENSKRHYLGLTSPYFFGNKGVLMANSLTRELSRHKTTNKIEAFIRPLGLRVRSDDGAIVQEAINSSNVIVELTGRNEPLQFLLDNSSLENITVYKAALYDSGNVMIVANIDVSKSFEEIINEWNDKRIKLGYEPDSAYSSISPANNSRVSMCAGVLNELIANETIKKGDYFIYDWRRNLGKTE